MTQAPPRWLRVLCHRCGWLLATVPRPWPPPDYRTERCWNCGMEAQLRCRESGVVEVRDLTYREEGKPGPWRAVGRVEWPE